MTVYPASLDRMRISPGFGRPAFSVSGVGSLVSGIGSSVSCAEIPSETNVTGLGREINAMLEEKHASGKEPSMIAEAMSKIKIGEKMMVNDGDETTAKLMYDGCTMGVEKLSEYINMYPKAEPKAKNAAEKLIKCEQRLADALRQYL